MAITSIGGTLGLPRRYFRASIVLAMAMIGIAGLGPVACDEKPPSAPQAQQSQQNPNTTDAAAPDGRPSAKQLLEGPRTTLPLGMIPLSVKVPTGWSIMDLEHSVFLQGPAPYRDADIHISLTAVPHMSADAMSYQLQGAAAKAAKSGGRYRVLPTRTTGPAQLVEQQESALLQARAATQPTTAPSVEPTTRLTAAEPTSRSSAATVPGTQPTTGPAIAIFKWSIWVFVPRPDGSFDGYVLQFVGLDDNEYAANEAFLRSIVDSLTYNASSTDVVSPGHP
jgi:hypothetical protein